MEASGQLHSPAILSPLSFGLVAVGGGGGASRPGRFAVEKHLLLLPAIEPRLLGCTAYSLVIMLARLLRFQQRRGFKYIHVLKYFNFDEV
jgi:hypothetical protein